jgi:manganese/iron transport system substrate-binding protein
MLQILKFRHLASLALVMGLCSCNTPPPTAETNSPTANSPATENGNRPLVVATTSVLCDLTKQVAQDTINLKCLVNPGEDPHVYQPKPEDRKVIESAKLILYGGYDFDRSLIKLVKATSNPAPKIAVHEVAVPKPIMGETHEHGEEGHKNGEEEKHAEGEAAPDPHVWHNPQNGIQMIETISDSLEKIAPNNALLYENKTKKITDELGIIDTWIKSQIATIPPKQRKLVTTHDSLGYYVKAYSLEFEGALSGVSTEATATAGRVTQLVKEIKQANVPTIFAETTVNPKLIEAVAKEAKVKVSDRELYADGLGDRGTEGETYQGILKANTRTIVEGLGGEYTPFE